MSVGRVLVIVAGSLVALIGLVVAAGGGTLLWANSALKDADGFFTTRTERFSVPGSAIVTERLDLTDVPGGPGRWADLRVNATGVAGRPIFAGVGRRDDVRRYLAGAPYAEITDVDLDPFRVTYRPRPGAAGPGPPGDEDFWAAQVEGDGPQTLTWAVDDGDWQIVAMNPDGGAGVALDASVGVRISYVLQVAIGLLVVGLLILAGGIVMIVLGARSRRPPPGQAGPPAAAAGPPAAPAA